VAGDFVRRFLFEHHPIRGHWVQLRRAWQELRAHQEYPAPVRALLGEATSAAALLASTLKFDGRLTFQLQGNGAVRLLVAQCSDDFRLRAVARFDPLAVVDDFRTLVGAGHVTVTVESQAGGSRYQGIVALEGNSLAACLETYFASSEQLPSVVQLAADAESAAGVLLQRIAAEGGRGVAAGDAADTDRVWRAAADSVARLDRDWLLRLGAEDLLQRALGAEDLRLFAGAPVEFECRCSEARVEGILRSLGVAEVRSVLAEQGAVTVTCEFCQRPFRFDAVDVERMFANGVVGERPGSVN
jgi:molecular chaperone Hsp33